MTLPGRSRTVVVEPLSLPARAPAPPPDPDHPPDQLPASPREPAPVERETPARG